MDGYIIKLAYQIVVYDVTKNSGMLSYALRNFQNPLDSYFLKG